MVKDLGSRVDGALTGKIAVGSLGTIQSPNGNILLQSISTTNGDIVGILAPKGDLASPVTAVAGTIGTVSAKLVAANLSSRVGGPNNKGFDIGYVHSVQAIPDSVTISSARGIGTIKVDVTAKGVTEKFKVVAAYGGQFEPGGPFVYFGAGLTIDVGAADFLGTVTFLPLGTIPVTYSSGNSLLSVTANGKKAVTWKVTGTGTSGTIRKQLVFSELTTGDFGWVEETDPFTDVNLLVDGKPAGAKKGS